jgi:CheY-like chemotaxis protein
MSDPLPLQDTEQVSAEGELTREAVRCRDEFLAMLAHELRNPLAAVRNAVQVLRLGGCSEPAQVRSLDVIDRQARHMARMLDDLLDVSRIIHGKIELRKEPVDLAQVLADAMEAGRPLLQKCGHRLTRQVPAGAMMVEGDATRLEQVFVNLLNNAARYTPPGGNVWLEVEPAGGRVRVRVRDDGEGIAPDMLGRVFELFTQADRSLARSKGGLGIGLTLVKKLVELHGGTVAAASEGPGRGSEFLVTLPLREPAGSAAAAGGDAAEPTGAVRVLLIEDNDDARTMLQELLRLWGYQVEAAGDGLGGLAQARARRPDVVLIDIGLPGLDGYEVARALRRSEGEHCPLLIAVTGYSQPSDRRRALAAGFDAHLVKPVELEQLTALIERARR